MSWNFREHDQREEIAELKKQLSVQGLKIGSLEGQLIKNNEELANAKGTLEETTYKLRKEADRAIELENTLTKRNDDLKNEKLTRENVENALRAAREELKSQEASTRDAQHLVNRLAQDANGSQDQYHKLLADKVKLESQIRELQGELRRQQLAPLPPLKTPSRPRASSLTNLKVASLERDLAEVRVTASTSQADLDVARGKLARVRSDLIRVENEKAVLEKKMAEKERKLHDALEDKDDLERELEFYRSQNGSGEREEELLSRLEDEEKKVALLEQQLSLLSQSKDMKRSIDKLQEQLNNEIARREGIEAREVELVMEKEEALNELDDAKLATQELERMLQEKDSRIHKLEQHERILREQLEHSSNHYATVSPEIDEAQVKNMLNAIDRLRAERDQLRADLEFLQLEMRFKVQALEARIPRQIQSSPSETELQESQALAGSGKLDLGRQRVQSLQVAMSAMLVTVQHLHSQNDCLREQVSTLASFQAVIVSRSEVELAALHSQLGEKQAQRSSIDAALADLQNQLQAKSEEVEHVTAHSHAVLASKDDEIAQTKLRLSDISNELDDERERRVELGQEVEQVQANCEAVQQELSDALERCERLQATQTSALSSDSAAQALTEQIKLLEGRVMRRTEQIGIHQHDIRRLETNMRLLEDRLEEVTGELDMAETEKTAMLEDCTTAREERDGAKKALERSEIEAERLTTLLRQAEDEVRELQARVEEAQQAEGSLTAKVEELAAFSDAVTERDDQINSLMESIKAAETELFDARAQATNLRKELEAAQESTARTTEDLQSQIQGDKSALSQEIERRGAELEHLVRELEASKVGHQEVTTALQSRNKELERSADEVQRLSLELEAARTSHKKIADALQSKDEEMERCVGEVQRLNSDFHTANADQQAVADALLAKQKLLEEKSGELQRLTAEFEAAKAKHEATAQKLLVKGEELDMNTLELRRLASELEAADVKQKEAVDALQAKDVQLSQASKRVIALEAEKTDLLMRLATFEADANNELNESTSLRSVLEEEHHRHEKEVKKLEDDLSTLKAEREVHLKASEQLKEALNARQEETMALLESAKNELEGQQALYDVLVREQQSVSSSREEEVADLKEQIAKLTVEAEKLQQSLQEEIDCRKRDLKSREVELQGALDSQESVESELRQNAQLYQGQLAELRASLMTLQDENTTMQSEMDNLSGECQRANLKSQSLEMQLASNEKELSGLREELAHVQELLSKSEKSGKTAEMNLLLVGQQHERKISSLRIQLKEHEKDEERIQKLQQIVGEMKEQISEMEDLLRAKCAEIEDHDDKFIQLLKEKKKLTSKIESLTKKNNGLQNKLSAASARSSKTLSPSLQAQSHQVSPPEPAPTALAIPAVPIQTPLPAASTPTFANLSATLPSQPTSFRAKMAEPARRTSGHKRLREVTLPMDPLPTTSSIGKKRPLPDDTDSVLTPVEARFADSLQPAAGPSTPPIAPSSSMPSMPSMPFMPSMLEAMSTPRQRRPLQTLRTGFTPVRGQGMLRPTLGQPSPIRRSNRLPNVHGTAITDVTNSPPKAKRLFTAEPGSTAPRAPRPPGKGWLGKIRGGGANALSRTRQQPSMDGLS